MIATCEHRIEILAKDYSESVNPEDVPNIEAVFQAIPITLNVGTSPRDWGEIIGWANGWKDLDSGTVTIVMSLDSEASQRLGDMTELFKLYSLGFAAVARRPEKRTGE